MGRRLPYDNATNSLIGPFLYFSFSLIGLATSIAIITTLCSVRFRRRKLAPPPTTPISNTEEDTTTDKNTTNATIFMSQEQPRTETTKLENTSIEGNSIEMSTKELPLPPSMQQPDSTNRASEFVKRTTSERRLSFKLSIKMPRSLSLARNWDKKEESDIGNKEKLKPDESTWMKTIILGEKCVPDEEEDAIIYEGKGKRISAYHPRNSISSSSMSLSRQWSSLALDVPQSHWEQISNI